MKTYLRNDLWLCHIFLAVLRLPVMASVIGAIALTFGGQSRPEVVVALGSAAVIGLAGLLAPSPLNR